MPAAHHVEIAGEEADHAVRHDSGQLHQQIAVVTYDGCTNTSTNSVSALNACMKITKYQVTVQVTDL